MFFMKNKLVNYLGRIAGIALGIALFTNIGDYSISRNSYAQKITEANYIDTDSDSPSSTSGSRRIGSGISRNLSGGTDSDSPSSTSGSRRIGSGISRNPFVSENALRGQHGLEGNTLTDENALRGQHGLEGNTLTDENALRGQHSDIKV
jgi:hypothetical protein